MTTDSDQPIYRDPARTTDERVNDLLMRMTVAEKAAELGSAFVFQLVDGTQIADRAAAVTEHGLGQVTRLCGASSLRATEAAEAANAIQRHLVENTRLGIPAIIHEEICAGLMAREATVFPQAIGVASTWRPELAEAMSDVVRQEMRAIGTHQGLSPVLDVCRDPRWGRTEETFGEDPHLVAVMGAAFVRGLQGATWSEGVVATAKHFVGYGASEGGLNWAPPHIPDRELHEVYLHPFEAAVKATALRSVMNAYNELDGSPCGADHDLLTGILRDSWGFDGYVVSDYFSVRQLETYHQLATDASEAASMALSAGLDIELPMTDCYGAPLIDAVDAGVVPIETLNRAVARQLRTKFELGLFEQPYVDIGRVPEIVATADSRKLALDAVRQSIVLLSNDGVLPIDPDAALSIAVIGPNADDPRNLLSDYSYAAHVESLLESRDADNVFHIPMPEGFDLDRDIVGERTVLTAIVEALPNATIRSARGCGVSSLDRDGIDEAVALAAASDVAIVVVGDKAGLSDDSTTGESRDRSSLDLPGVQEDLVRAVQATGTPVVLVLVSGRPCGSVATHADSAAVVAAWLPGTEGPTAIADVLTGVVNPGGRLPISWPRSAGHIPVFYRHKLSGGRSHWKGDYADGPVSPLYPFGHGLSYTTFEIESTAPSPSAVAPDGEIVVEVTVSNTGNRDGDEVVQVFTRDPQASLTRPVLELKAFAKVSVPAGESRRASFAIAVGQLGFYDRQLRYIVEPGEIEVHVGPSVDRLRHAGNFSIATDDGAVEVPKVFDAQIQITTSTAAQEAAT